MNREQAFKELYYKEYEQLCRYALSYVRDEHTAKDIVQETFVRIWEQQKVPIGSPEISYYLITSVRNNSISWLRNSKKLPVAYTETAPEPEPEPFFYMSLEREKEDADLKRIRDALNLLPPKCKEVFLLIRLHGLSYKKAAETLGVSVKTVDNHMLKAAQVLKDIAAMIICLLFGPL
jgi:RNA polymerase sigma-70 factor (ECF subfamily)